MLLHTVDGDFKLSFKASSPFFAKSKFKLLVTCNLDTCETRETIIKEILTDEMFTNFSSSLKSFTIPLKLEDVPIDLLFKNPVDYDSHNLEVLDAKIRDGLRSRDSVDIFKKERSLLINQNIHDKIISKLSSHLKVLVRPH